MSARTHPDFRPVAGETRPPLPPRMDVQTQNDDAQNDDIEDVKKVGGLSVLH
jgi:hypothetical protein